MSEQSPPDAARSVPGALRRLRDLLARDVSNENEAKRIVQDSGASTSESWWSTSPTSFWDTALAEADRAERMEDLFESADPLFGDNPEWREAKTRYRQAKAGRRRPKARYLARDADLYVHEQNLRSLGRALDQIGAGISRDPRISDAMLTAAGKRLGGAVGPLLEALLAALSEETSVRARYELQQLHENLGEHQKSASELIAALRIAKPEAAGPLYCGLAEERDALLAAGAEAISLLARSRY